jgi:hypothetical protein
MLEMPPYKMGIVMCKGTEHVHVEKLPDANGGNSGFGALANQTVEAAN